MRRLFPPILLLLLISMVVPGPAFAQSAVVRAVIFYSPTCPHCHEVINVALPPIWDAYGGELAMDYIPPAPGEEEIGPSLVGIHGEQLEILYINTMTRVGSELFGATIERFAVPAPEQAVPTLIVGSTRLIGSIDIPAELPGIIEQGLAEGGIDWPDIPGLEASMAGLLPVPTEESSPNATDPDPPADPGSDGSGVGQDPPVTLPGNSAELSALDKFKLDPLANSIAVVVLIGLIFTLVGAGVRFSQSHAPDASPDAISPLIPLLAVGGAIVAGYLTFVETTGTEAVCGPVGDCNAVQQSPYATLFGLLPVGLLGLLGYAAMLIGWLLAAYARSPLAEYGAVSLLLMAAFGTLFSGYLTFLEPFVIGATCAWCLTSAVLIAVILWLSVDPATNALRRLFHPPADPA